MKKEGDLLEINRWDLLEKVSMKEGGYSGGCSRAIRTIRLQQKSVGLLANQGGGLVGHQGRPNFLPMEGGVANARLQTTPM